MRRMILTGCLALMASAAHAQDSAVVEACKRLAAHLYTTDEVAVAVVQDFSELTPPRARLKLATFANPTVTCTFGSRTPPMQLTEYCHMESCELPGASRFDELRYLLEQDGY